MATGCQLGSLDLAGVLAESPARRGSRKSLLQLPRNKVLLHTGACGAEGSPDHRPRQLSVQVRLTARARPFQSLDQAELGDGKAGLKDLFERVAMSRPVALETPVDIAALDVAAGDTRANLARG